ncbi:MAG TPA: hypothetical protein VMT19_05475 [Thermoanaerobaculaceae bacterium]|nr:hypothetical protein [Thermoanaerobaculaceae bacterium]
MSLRTFELSNLRTVVLTVILVLLSGVVQAADPFYMRLLREGTDAYNRRDFVTAARELRIACFGLLDEPDVLADGLVRLGLAQAAAGETSAFAETFQRVAEVEERFGGFSKAAIPEDLRDAFSQLVVKLIPRSTLAERPAIAKLISVSEPRTTRAAPAAAAAPRPAAPPVGAATTAMPRATPPPTRPPEVATARAAVPAPPRPAATVAPPTATPTRTPAPTSTPAPVVAAQSAGAPAVGAGAASGSLTSPPPVAEATPPTEAKKPPLRQATAEEQRELNAIQDLVRKNKITEALKKARLLADSRHDLAEAQFVAAELAYRTLRFPEAVEYFRRGGDPGDKRPLLLFYEAVSLYETGEAGSAAEILKRALPNIRRTSYVEGYIQKILNPGAAAARKP